MISKIIYNLFLVFYMLLKRNSLSRHSSVKSLGKNKSLVKIPSCSKLPKDFFRHSVVTNDTNDTTHQPTRNELEFTFMNPCEKLTKSDYVRKASTPNLVKKKFVRRSYTNQCAFMDQKRPNRQLEL